MTRHSETGYVLRGGMPESYKMLVVDPFLRRIGPPISDKQVLDAHAGRGEVGFYIAEHGYPVTLLDYNPIAFNNETIARAESNRVRLVNRNIKKYAQEYPASVYAVHAKDPWDGNVGTYTDNVIGAISIFQDLLEPGGHMLVSSIHLWGFLLTHLLMKQMGFRKIRVSSWTPTTIENESDWYVGPTAEKRYVLSCVK